MVEGLDIADLPRLLLRSEEPFDASRYLPEWQFWFHVAEKEGANIALPLGEACARFFLENYVGLDKSPPGYREMLVKYQDEWWASIPRPKEREAGVWDLFNLMQELQNAAAELSREFVQKRKGKSGLVVALRDTVRDPPRIEFEIGRLPHVFHIRAYHPLTGRYYWPEWFFGYFGPGDVRIWALSEMSKKIESVFDFVSRFLPLFASCTHARKPVPYEQVRGA
jgi:hypothetical protein